MYNVDPKELVRMIKMGKNPQQLMTNVLQSSMGNTPLGANLLEMVQRGDAKGIEQVARNVAKERGIDFDAALAKFRRQMDI